MSTDPSARQRSGGWRGVALVFLALLFVSLVAVAVGFQFARPALERWAAARIEAALDAALVPDVRIEGPLRWQLWPEAWVSLEQISVSDDDHTMIRIPHLLIELDTDALKTGQLVLKRIVVAQLAVLPGADPMRWVNVDAWLVPGRAGGAGVPPVIRELVVHEARLELEAPIPITLNPLSASIRMPVMPAQRGTIVVDAGLRATVQDVPLAGQISHQGEFRIDETGLQLDRTVLDFTGNAAFREGADIVLRVIDLAASTDTLQAEIELQVSMAGAGDAGGRFAGALSYAFDPEGVDHVHANGRLGLRLPSLSEEAGAIEFDLETLAQGSVVLAKAQGSVVGRVDDSALTGNWRLDRQALRPLHLEIGMDRLNLDDYLIDAAGDGAPPDLAPWRSWPLSAELSIGRFFWRGLETRDAWLVINPGGE